MLSKKRIVTTIASTAFVLSFGITNAAWAFTTACVGVPSVSNITWTASSSAGVAPVTYLWGNGSTSSVQVISVVPGTYAMTLQVTDASSTMATTTCAATVVPLAPTITSFVATPSSITSGQSSVLSWVVANASSTSLDNGIGAVNSTSITIAPTATTMYTLSAVNPSGTTSRSVTETVSATTTGTGNDVQIQNLLIQIANLRAQIAVLMQAQNDLQHQALQLISTLHRGMSGDEVRKLQEVLATDKNVFSKDNVTGFFGPMTEEAVKRFQHHFGLDTVGMVGPRTLEKLNGLLQEHHVMDDGNFQEGEVGDIGTSDDGEHNNEDAESSRNQSLHDTTSTDSSSHDNAGEGNNHEN